MALHDKRFGDRIDDSPGKKRGVFRPFERPVQHGELVAADTRDHIVLARAADEARRHLLQQFVADRVAERIIGGLEVIEIDAEHGHDVAPRDPRLQILHALVHEDAVGEAGQRIVARQMTNALLVPAAPR